MFLDQKDVIRGSHQVSAMPEYTHSHASEKRIADLVRQLVFGLGHGLISILGLSVGSHRRREALGPSQSRGWSGC
jgi:hypothetical protein